MDNNLERIDVETIVDTFSTLIEQGTEAVVNFFKSDTWESVLDIGSELSKASKVIVFIRKTASIPDKFFMNKMEKYCQEHQLPGRLIPIPSQITAGCGLAWKTEPDAKEQFIEQLKQGEISWEQMQIVEL